MRAMNARSGTLFHCKESRTSGERSRLYSKEKQTLYNVGCCSPVTGWLRFVCA